MTVGLSPIVHLGGSPLAASWQEALVEVRVELEFQLPGRATLRFTDPGYTLLSSKKVSLGTTVEVRDPSGDHLLISAEVTTLSCEQRAGEQPELVAVALDRSHRLGRKTVVKVFQGVAYSDVVSSLASGAGLTPSVDESGERFDYLMQAETDLILVTELARRCGFDWWVEGTTLHFEKPKSHGEVSLALGAELRSFSARAAGFQPSQVVVDGWDRDQQDLISHEATTVSAPLARSDFADLARQAHSAFGPAGVFSGGLAAGSSTEAGKLAQTVLDRAATASVTAKGVAEGNGGVALGKTAKVSGAGPLDGDYPITFVEHLYRPAAGFVTRFASGERRPTGLVDSLAGGVGAGAYAGPAHLRPGITVGKVTSNNDPKHWGRVRVKYAGLSADVESDWARVVTVGGGKERGSVWIPEVDDEVLLGFESGDARRPVVIGGLFGEQATMPATEIADGKVQSRAMTSRLGHVVAFLDGTAADKQAIELVLAGKQHTLHLGQDKLAVTVPAGTPVEITAGGTAIKFSGSGDVAVQGVNVTVKADNALKLQGTQVSIEAEAALQMKANAEAKLGGAIVEVQSQGPAKLAGQPVMIN
ncbi:MAG TPA: phage baseplate assembly protein V [Acidimicrobiales bacterium]|nr:phage baseplate assembly protein V [Acidimicrobiales bacterium]